MTRFTLLIIMLLVYLHAFTQHLIQGKVIDSQSGQALTGVSLQEHKSGWGTISDVEGRFALTAFEFPTQIQIRFLGYETQMITLTISSQHSNLIIEMVPTMIDLDEINILVDQATARYNPIAFTNISQDQIITGLGDRPLPEIMNFSPGIFAVREGGGSGDASLRIRGFEQENIAVLLNGVPINGAENGLVYWNNWMGLTEVASNIQIQRGIGASKIALNSVGGTVNIRTTDAGKLRGGSLNFSTTSYGNKKLSFSYQSGLNEKGWSVSFLGSRTTGEGYIDGTYVDGWAYFFNISKEINQRQRVIFTLLGGPERHGQRNLKLSKAEVDKFGPTYNKEWGVLNGELKNSSENFYHKPHAALNHYLSVGSEGMLATSVYFSPGKGGGKWHDNLGYDVNLYQFRDETGQIDWHGIYRYNASNTDTFTLASGEKVNGYSKIVQTNFLASHIWTGLISSYETKLSKSTKWMSGIHYRFFRSDLRQQIADLLGGNFYIDDYSWSIAGVAGREQVKKNGDYIRIHNGALLHQTTVFTQVETNVGHADFFLSASGSDNRFKRHDVYNYPDNKWSETVSKPGFDIKTGISYLLTDQQHVFLNAAFFSKAPYYKFIFGNFSNQPVQDIRNEKVKTLEGGYQYRTGNLQALFSAYYTLWEDVSFLSNEYIQLENETQTRAMVSGLSALHRGLELELNAGLTPEISLRGYISTGSWKWQNDVSAVLFNDRDIAVDTVHVYAKGLFTGGQPQFQFGLALDFKLFKTLELTVEAIYSDRQYAQFDPSGRQNPNDRAQSYRLPSYTLANAGFRYPFKLGKEHFMLFGNVNNLLNSQHILNGEDGSGHNLETFRGFWSFGRTLDAGIRYQFGE